MQESDHATRFQQIASWSYCLGVLVVVAVGSMIPGHPNPLSGLSSIVSLIAVFLILFGKTPSLYLKQVTIFAVLGLIASAYACIVYWNNPVIILFVPVLLTMAIFTTFLFKAIFRRAAL